MGNKIFVSYKYHDSDVYGNNPYAGRKVIVRNYVDKLGELLKEEDHIYKGEYDDEDLSHLEDDTIQQKLADRIHDSTVTIVMISPHMRERGRKERDQWIPWEVAYSLRTENREVGKSYPNAMIAVVFPDAKKSYDYYMTEKTSYIGRAIFTTTLKTNILFPILQKNMFNDHDKKRVKAKLMSNRNLYREEVSYIHSVKWSDFKSDPQAHIERAIARQQNRRAYKINTNLTG